MDISVESPGTPGAFFDSEPRRVGRKKLWGERIIVRFPSGTRGRIDAVLTTGREEDWSDFVRLAVERELRRREAAKPRRKK